MSASIARRLIYKDLYLLRPFMLGALALGGVGIALMGIGGAQPFLGWIVLFIATVLLGIFTTAVGLTGERKERVHLFVLTLPTSPAQYTAAKLAASAIAFLVPWAILLATALAVIAATAVPDAFMPFLSMLLLYAVCYYSAYLAVALVTDSVIWSTVVIIIGNTVPVFLIPALLRISNIGADPTLTASPWSSALTVIAYESGFCIAVLGLALYVRSQQRDFI